MASKNNFITEIIRDLTQESIKNGLHELVNSLCEIDAAMTKLSDATDETSTQYETFLDSVNDSAHSLGTSLASLIEQTAGWARAGHSLSEAENLAKISSVYANISKADNDTAVNNIMAAMDAFHIKASDSIRIVDKLNKLEKEGTVSAKDFGDALSLCASAMAAGGTGLDQTLAMLAGGIPITQDASAMAAGGTSLDQTLAMLAGGIPITQDASAFGSFLATGNMRLLGMRDELAALGEEVDETADSIDKIQTQVLNHTGGKVNIFDGTGQLKDYYTIMEEISEVYEKLAASDKTDLTKILFGSRHESQGTALLQAFQSGEIQKNLEAALHSEGSAMEEQERFLDSLEAKTRQFEAAFQSLSSTVLDSDLLKGLTDLGTGGVQALDSILDKLGSAGTAGLGAGLFAGLKNVGMAKLD